MTISCDKITSAKNPKIRLLRSLQRKKVRNQTGLFLAEGTRLIAQALARGWKIDTLVISTSGCQRPATLDLAQRIAAQGGHLIEVPDRLASTIVCKDNPQTLIAAIRQRPLDIAALDQTRSGLWLGLHECRDPGNLGTIMRTTDCAGLAGLVMIGNCCDAYSTETVRASMGSLFDVPLARADFKTFNAWRIAAGLTMVAASLNTKTGYTDIDFKPPCLVLMGNEQSGLPPCLETASDFLCQIPMRGGADSLNLAQATAILIYEAWRQRGFA